MKHVLTFFFMLLISISMAWAQAPLFLEVTGRETASPTTLKLLKGIAHSNQQLVKEAIAEGIDLRSVRFGPYKDTALMAALRMYCYSLINRINTGNEKNMIRKTMGTGFLSMLVGGITYARTLEMSKALTASLLSYATLFIIASSIPWRPSASARVVELLLQQDTNFNARNAEGLTALDLLRSYHGQAHQLQDEMWYKFLTMLLHKQGIYCQQNLLEDIANDLAQLEASV
jgi:hypothetical protein